MALYRRFEDETTTDDDDYNRGYPTGRHADPTGPLAGTVADAGSIAPAEYTLYNRRWLVVAILAFVNISSAMTWITFAPVANYAADYLHTTDANINWLSTIYMATIPFGFIAVWIMDSYGLAPVIILGAVCNTVGVVLRYLSVLSIFKDYQFAVVMTGQGIASLAQPCFLFTPTKVAGTWFPEGQRTLANTLGSTANPLGILVGILASSMLVKKYQDVEFLLLVYMIPGIVTGVIAVAAMCYCKNAPPSPPSASAASHHESFFSGLKKLVCIKAFWVLFFVFGAGLAVFNAIISIMQEVLCPHGYSDNFAGLCGALMIGGGIVGAFLSGVYVDRSKKFALVAKVCFAMAAISSVALALITRYPSDMAMQISVAVVSGVFGFFGFAQFAISLELGVEATYPICEGTSAGFLITSGQLQGLLLMQAAEWLSQPLSPYEEMHNTCNVANNPANATTMTRWSESTLETSTESPFGPVARDMSRSMLFFAGYASLAACLYILGFHTKYKRMRAEHCNAAEHILNFSRRSFGAGQNVIY